MAARNLTDSNVELDLAVKEVILRVCQEYQTG